MNVSPAEGGQPLQGVPHLWPYDSWGKQKKMNGQSLVSKQRVSKLNCVIYHMPFYMHFITEQLKVFLEL